METAELQKIAEQNRAKRETGTAFLISILLLGIFLFIPLTSHTADTASQEAVAAEEQKVFPRVSVEAQAVIVYDIAEKKTLYEKNADAQLPLASLTKLLTVYAAYREMLPNAQVVIPSDVIGLEAPRAFNIGQAFTLNDIARLTLTASLNDGAAAIAIAAAQNRQVSETDVLASAAAAIGLTQTFAVNGNGLDVNAALSGGYGSARDVAELAGTFVAVAPEAARATTAAFAEATSVGGTHYKVKNTNPFVDTIPGLMLSKTGLTDLAGGNLALVVDVGIGHPVAVVVLGSTATHRFTDAQALVAAAFDYFAQP